MKNKFDQVHACDVLCFDYQCGRVWFRETPLRWVAVATDGTVVGTEYRTSWQAADALQAHAGDTVVEE